MKKCALKVILAELLLAAAGIGVYVLMVLIELRTTGLDHFAFPLMK